MGLRVIGYCLLTLFTMSGISSANAEGLSDKALTVETCDSRYFERLIAKLAAKSIKARVLNDGFISASVRTKIRRVKGSSPSRASFSLADFAPENRSLYEFTLSENDASTKTARVAFNLNSPLSISPAIRCSNAMILTATVRASYTITDAKGKIRRKSATGNIVSPSIPVAGFYTRVKVGG